MYILKVIKSHAGTLSAFILESCKLGLKLTSNYLFTLVVLYTFSSPKTMSLCQYTFILETICSLALFHLQSELKTFMTHFHNVV